MMTNDVETNQSSTSVAPMTDRTMHNETNFNPGDYQVLEYLDNEPPKWQMFVPFVFGCSAEAYNHLMEEARTEYNAALRHWNEQMDRYFPFRSQNQPNIHKCTHCGNVQVRYIVAVRHIPTNQNVVFGDVCVARLEFANRNEFVAAQVRARAAQGNARIQLFLARERFLTANPEFAAIVNNEAEVTNPCHANNAFVKDIIAKFNKYGKLSDAQVSAFIRSIQRDHEFAARRAAQAAAAPAGPVPTGERISVEGEIVSVKVVNTNFGSATKMLVKLANGSKVWTTVPTTLQNPQRNGRVTLRVSVVASRDDVTFGIGKRPHLISYTAPAQN